MFRDQHVQRESLRFVTKGCGLAKRVKFLSLGKKSPQATCRAVYIDQQCKSTEGVGMSNGIGMEK